MQKLLILFCLLTVLQQGKAQTLRFPLSQRIVLDDQYDLDSVDLKVGYYMQSTDGFRNDLQYLETHRVKLQADLKTFDFRPLKGKMLRGSLADVSSSLKKGKRFVAFVFFQNNAAGEYKCAGLCDMNGSFFPDVRMYDGYFGNTRNQDQSLSYNDAGNMDLPQPPPSEVVKSDDTNPVKIDVVYQEGVKVAPDEDIAEHRHNPALNTSQPLIAEKDLKGKKTVSLPLNLNNWKSVHFNSMKPNTPAVFGNSFSENYYTRVQSGLKVNATTYRMGAWLVHRSSISFTNKEVYLKWKLNAQGDFTDIHAILYTGKDDTETFMKEIKMLSYLSTRNQWDESVLIPYTDSWFYTRLVFTKNSCTSYTATNNYDNKGGKLIQTFTKPVPVTTGHIGLGFGDVYSGNAAYFILGEAIVQTK